MGCSTSKGPIVKSHQLSPVNGPSDGGRTKPLYFFVLGGPGSGKGTQCAKLVSEYDFVHLSAGDLLRAERDTGSENAQLINSYISEGKIVPVEITCNLIKQAMQKAGWAQKMYLIDGFPRSQDNLDGWIKVMQDCSELGFVLFFDADAETMTQRILERGKTSGRVDDNIETLKKRFDTFQEQSMPVVNHFEKEGKVRKVNALQTIDEVYADVKKAFSGFVGTTQRFTEQSVISQATESVFNKIDVTAHQINAENVAEKIKENKSKLETPQPDQKYKPLVMVGPSGAGKGTLLQVVTDQYPDKFGFSVSYTTRAPREGEVHGKSYFFVTKEEFKQKIEEDGFIEYCEVHTNFYGTAKSQIEDIQKSNKIPLLDIDIQGAKKFYKAFPNSNYVFICPPSIASLKERLIARGTETEETLKTRLGNALSEANECFSLPEMIHYRVVNEDLAVAKKTYELIIKALYAEEFAESSN